MLAAAAVSLLLCCRKSEAPGPPAAGKPPAGASQAAAPAAPSGEGASIRDAADPNRPPFSGFHGARGLALDGRGHLWLLDFEHAAVNVYDADGGYHGGWGGKGDGPYQLKDPCGIAVRGDDVYVADTWNGRVTHFTLAGAFHGKAPGDFYGPRGVAVAPDGRVWIADTGNDRAVVCEKDLRARSTSARKEMGPNSSRVPSASPWAPPAASTSPTPPTGVSRSSTPRAASGPASRSGAGARTPSRTCRWTKRRTST